MTHEVGHGRRSMVWQQAWPIILANASVPLLGLVDTAVIGHTGLTHELGALAFGAVIFSFLYWGFGFLRMSTTGFVAQAHGAGDAVEVRSSFARAVLMGGALGAVLIIAQSLLLIIALSLMQGSADVLQATSEYFRVRIWGAPATLALFAINGYFIGLGKSRHLLALQVALNVLNMVLNLIFAGLLGWGVMGIALGTIIAEWTLCLISLGFIISALRRHLPTGESLWSRQRILAREKMRATLVANRDIMIRTFALLLAFAWFANQGAQYGDTILAANHILLQLISFSAFFLDGFAFVAEAHIGHAVGQKSRSAFRSAVRYTTELAVLTAAILASIIAVFGPLFIALLTNITPVQEQAEAFVLFAAVYVFVSVAAFQLDGIFIGATRSGAMRNASVLSLLLFLLAWWPLSTFYGVTGLWLSFIFYVLIRAVSLLFYFDHVNRLFKQ